MGPADEYEWSLMNGLPLKNYVLQYNRFSKYKNEALVTYRRDDILLAKRLCVFKRWQPECHICACRCEHHVFRIELDALNRSRMIAIQDAHFKAGISIPHMHSSIGAAREYKLRVWTVR